MQKFNVFCQRIDNKEELFTKGIEVTCVKCGKKVWLSDSTLEGIRNRHFIISFDKTRNLYPYCEEHFDEPDLNGKLMPLTDEQLKEINDYL